MRTPMPAAKNERRSLRSWASDRLAAAGLGGLNVIGAIAIAIIASILGAYLGVTVIAAIAPTYFLGIANIVGVMNTLNVNDSTANAMGPILGKIIAFLGIFGILGLIGAVLIIRYHKSSV